MMIHSSDKSIVLFERCLAIQLQRVYRPCEKKASSILDCSSTSRDSGTSNETEEDSYLLTANGLKLFQAFQEINSKCFWNSNLLQAIASVQYRGHVAPSTLLLSGTETVLEVIRGGWARKVLRAPVNFRINVIGDLDGCNIRPITQSQFTPLPEALCYVIWDLNQIGKTATLDAITAALQMAFPELIPPTHPMVYSILGTLIKDRKIYHTGSGYGIVTPDTYRRTAYFDDEVSRPILMSDEEALALAHGATEVYPAGYVTHRAIQTNLVDVICRGSPTDKIIYPRLTGQSLEVIPTLPSKLERQRSLRTLAVKKFSTLDQKLGGSLRLSPSKAKKLMETSLQRDHCLSSDVTIEQLDPCQESTTKDKVSLLSRIFKRAASSRRKNNISSFSAQFPPPEWLESGLVLHSHSVAVQTCPPGTLPENCGAINVLQVRPSSTVNRRSRSQVRPHVKDIFIPKEHRRPSSLHRPAETEAYSSDERSAISRKSAILSSARQSLDETPSRASSLGRRSALRHLRELDERLETEIQNTQKQPVSPTRSFDSQYSSMPDQNSRFSSPSRNSPTPSDSRSVSSDRRSPMRDFLTPRNRKLAVDNVKSFALPSVCESAERPKKIALARSDSYKNANKYELSNCKSPNVQHVLPSLSPQKQISPPFIATVSPQKVVSPERCVSPVKQIIAENRERFFQEGQKKSPRNIEDKIDQMKFNQRMVVMDDLKSPNLVRTTNFRTMNCFELTSPSVDCKVQLPSGKKYNNQESKILSPDGSRIINISVTRSESKSFPTAKGITNLEKPKINDEKIMLTSENFADYHKNEKCTVPEKCIVPEIDENTEFRNFPSLTELNIHFKSITGQRILQGISANSIDTLVEVNMCADGKEERPMIESLGFV
ncbi:uncharacterized protein LOC136036516 isoform X2 [Artemia franciscana]